MKVAFVASVFLPSGATLGSIVASGALVVRLPW
jgi:hypothetical protein